MIKIRGVQEQLEKHFRNDDHELICLSEDLIQKIDDIVRNSRIYRNRNEFIFDAIEKFITDAVEEKIVRSYVKK